MFQESLKTIADSLALTWALVVLVAILCGTVIALVSVLARYLAVIVRGWPPDSQEEDEEDQGKDGGQVQGDPEC